MLTQTTPKQRIRRHFLKHCLPAHFSHDYPRDEKYIQDVFRDNNIKLRFNVLSNTAQVWYESQEMLNCVFDIEPPYNIHRAIYFLKQQQKDKYEMREMYEQYIAQQEKDSNQKIDEIASETAGFAEMRRKGKVTSSGGL